MELIKKDGGIILQNIEYKKLVAFLKCQINCDIVFQDLSNIEIEKFTLTTRLVDGLYVDSKVLTYKELLSKFAEFNTYKLIIVIDDKTYTNKFSLINLLIKYTINPDILENCIYIDYNDNVFEIINKNLSNGDSDKMYYFELNDTILGFSEQGPHLITDNESINSIVDVICV